MINHDRGGEVNGEFERILERWMHGYRGDPYTSDDVLEAVLRELARRDRAEREAAEKTVGD